MCLTRYSPAIYVLSRPFRRIKLNITVCKENALKI